MHIEIPAQFTPASSLCTQLCDPKPRFLHSISLSSVPVHATSSNQILPVPSGTELPYIAVAAVCLQREQFLLNVVAIVIVVFTTIGYIMAA